MLACAAGDSEPPAIENTPTDDSILRPFADLAGQHEGYRTEDDGGARRERKISSELGKSFDGTLTAFPYNRISYKPRRTIIGDYQG